MTPYRYDLDDEEQAFADGWGRELAPIDPPVEQDDDYEERERSLRWRHVFERRAKAADRGEACECWVDRHCGVRECSHCWRRRDAARGGR